VRPIPPIRSDGDPTDCDRVADCLSDYLDGELDPREARTVAAHLAGCRGCARTAAELALTIAALHGLRQRRP
jgi:anti-sigma factor RsiW